MTFVVPTPTRCSAQCGDEIYQFKRTIYDYLSGHWCHWTAQNYAGVCSFFLTKIVSYCLFDFTRTFSAWRFRAEVSVNVSPMRCPRSYGNLNLFFVNTSTVTYQHRTAHYTLKRLWFLLRMIVNSIPMVVSLIMQLIIINILIFNNNLKFKTFLLIWSTSWFNGVDHARRRESYPTPEHNIKKWTYSD